MICGGSITGGVEPKCSKRIQLTGITVTTTVQNSWQNVALGTSITTTGSNNVVCRVSPDHASPQVVVQACAAYNSGSTTTVSPYDTIRLNIWLASSGSVSASVWVDLCWI
jgi:hypothetical protein